MGRSGLTWLDILVLESSIPRLTHIYFTWSRMGKSRGVQHLQGMYCELTKTKHAQVAP